MLDTPELLKGHSCDQKSFDHEVLREAPISERSHRRIVILRCFLAEARQGIPQEDGVRQRVEGQAFALRAGRPELSEPVAQLAARQLAQLAAVQGRGQLVVKLVLRFL